MIGRLSDDVLLKIFRYYLDEYPRFWPTLVHICRKWRRIVFSSQHALHLRLFCSSGTPVLRTLDHWPALPIVIEYGGSLALDLPSPEDEVNIIAALKRSDRVSSISLTVTTSLQEKLSTVKRPLLELEDLILLSQDSVPLTLPCTFLWGPRLRRLRLTRIDIPGLLQLLNSSRNLEDLQLHDALNPHYFSIEELADSLSGLSQLQSLSLYFPSTTRYLLPPPLCDQLIVLPALTHLNLRGVSWHLGLFVDRIDAPHLEDIQVTLIDESVFDFSKLDKFIDRTEIRNSLCQARILSSERAISISLTQPGASTCFKLQSFSESLSSQLLVMSHILPGFSALLPNVEDLRITATPASSQNSNSSFDGGLWQYILSLFTGVKWLHLDLNDLRGIVYALQGSYWQPEITMLPALYKLYLPQPGPRHVPLSEAIVSFMTSRCRSGYPIGVEYERLSRISELHGRGPSPGTVPLDPN